MARLARPFSKASACAKRFFKTGVLKGMSGPSHTARFDLQVKRSRAGLGLFTLSDIPSGRTIIEYVGRRIPSRPETRNLYTFSVNSRWDIDGSPYWNKARYFNHSCRPNCEAINRRGRIFFVAKRKIRAGEELTFNYGKEYFDEHIRPKGCRCEKCLVAS